MKKKTIMMMATTLIALLLLTPIVKAGVMHYWWDNVYYVAGTDIDYPHPDNVYYDISRTADWTKLGYALYHCQINKDSTFQIIVGSLAFSAFVGLVVTLWLGGGTMAAFVGGLTGIALATFIQMVIDYYFVDERGCIWFWVSVQFVHWLIANLSWLGPLCVSQPAVGYGQILIAFQSYGYLRVGMVTFHDALGIEDPRYTNYPPNTPSTPSGPASGYVGTTYSYSASTTDADGDNVRYRFDWGDDTTTTTGWYASGSTASASHSWGSSGTYYVKVKAQDEYSEWSGWSPSLTVTIVNRAPNTPSKPCGPTSGYINVQYTYTAMTTDPDGDDVRYEFEFSGVSFWTGWYASGVSASVNMATNTPGTYYVRARAQDVNGLCSGWSPHHTVTIELPVYLSISIYPTSGTTDPAPGTHTYGYGSSVTVTASPYPDRTFCFWILDGSVYYQNPITVTMNSDHTLCAYFSGGGGGGGGGTPHPVDVEPE